MSTCSRWGRRYAPRAPSRTRKQSCQAANQAVSNYQINTQTTYEKAGENINTYGTKVNQKFDEMANKSSTTADAVVDMSSDMVTAMGGIQSAAYELDST